MFHYALIFSLYSTYLSILQHAVFVFKELSQEKCPVFLIITTWSACSLRSKPTSSLWKTAEVQWCGVENFWAQNWSFQNKCKNVVQKKTTSAFWCWSIFEPHNRQTAGNSAGTKRPSEMTEGNNSSSEINKFQTGLGRWQRTTTEASNDAIPRINRVKPRNAVRWWLSRKLNIDPRWAGVEIKQKESLPLRANTVLFCLQHEGRRDIYTH